MQQLPDATSRKIALLIGERAEREALLDFTAVLALRGPVRVLDAGNSFDPLPRQPRHSPPDTPTSPGAGPRIRSPCLHLLPGHYPAARNTLHAHAAPGLRSIGDLLRSGGLLY